VTGTDADNRDGRGRPAERLALDPGAAQYVGIDFARERVLIAVANASHEIITEGHAAYSSQTSWTERVELAIGLLESLAGEAEIRLDALRAIAIGFPRPQDPHREPTSGENSESLLVRERFAERFQVPVLVDNNVRFAALGEASWGRDNNSAHLLYIRVSSGIGGGIVVDGRVQSGAFGFAAELGHVTVDRAGVTCQCGKRGCLETVASIGSVIDSCRSVGALVESADDVRAAAAIGDPLVIDVLRKAADAIGRVLGNSAVVLNPSEIVVAGEVVSLSPSILKDIERVVRYELIPSPNRTIPVREARLGDNAGAYGALVALFRQPTSRTQLDIPYYV